jgi:proteasome assembly chaperone (PAC2) family protein
MKIRLHFDIKLREPILLAGWPGMGNVGVGAVDYLRRHLKAQEFGEIDMHEHFTPEAIVVEQGIAKLPEVPGNAFAFSRSPDLIFFVSEAQVSGPGALALTNLMVDLAEQFEVRRIYTCAAFAMPIGYRERTRVLGVATDEQLRDSLVPHGAEILPQGMISGLNGLLLGVAGARGIGAACLLATIPQYAMSLPNPRGSRALVEALGSLLGVATDLSDFEAPVRQMDAVMSQIEERMRTAFESHEGTPGEGEQEGEGPGVAAESGPVGKEEVPGYVMKRLEELFRATARDRSNAGRLKEELDRWGLYELYEDRFLDLFRGGREGGEESLRPGETPGL